MMKEDQDIAEVEIAYRFWLKDYPYKEADKQINKFLQEPILEGWVRRARKALFLSTNEMSQRLGISRSAYAMFEAREMVGEVSLRKMKIVAEAMDCEFIYAIRPLARVPFSRLIWNNLVKVSINHGWLSKCFQKNRSGALAAISKKVMKRSLYRREQGWSERR